MCPCGKSTVLMETTDRELTYLTWDPVPVDNAVAYLTPFIVDVASICTPKQMDCSLNDLFPGGTTSVRTHAEITFGLESPLQLSNYRELDHPRK